MADGPWRPDVVIAIDFGMTCTGVAYSTSPAWTAPQAINSHWPGKATCELVSKVDTAVSYEANTQTLRSWGFECDEDDPSVEVNKYFKLALDRRFSDPSGFAPPHHEARQWYQDYLACLYKFIMDFFRDRFGSRFLARNVEFLFSVPTTWKDASMIADIEGLIKSAGYGQQANQRVVLSLTEAEAAAVYASKQDMQRGDVFLCADCGGGTTDLNMLRMTSDAGGKIELDPLQCNEGAPIGSTLIDYKAEKMILDRLERIKEHLHGDPEALASQMIQDRFLTYKCSFGNGSVVPKLLLPIPGLAPGLFVAHAGIEDSRMVLRSEELQRIFDEQINKIGVLIDEQLRLVQSYHASESVRYLILSGGLGSSPYLQKRLRDRYERGKGGDFPNAQNMEVLVAEKPQLAVVYGLVLARIQALKGGNEVIPFRRCPVSYGVLCREPYDAIKHQGEDIEQDPYDKKRWAEKQVSWFVKRGQKVGVDEGIVQRFQYKIRVGQEREPWRAKIVMSTMPPTQLPRSAKHEGVRQVCTVETVLDNRDMKPKNNKWYHVRKMYNQAEFDVKLNIGTGLQFEIWGHGGRRSYNHDKIEVEWQPAEDATRSGLAAPNDAAMYRV
ncbi:hypothetical protein LTR08_002762 [Meristemomyces frigidus]|nr:hypothetical protein LTR08_002762 [Meristemomyces frigidus]